MNRIKVIDTKYATGRLREIYDDIIEKRGKLADVHKIQSLRPESIVKHMDLYIEIMFTKSELSRAEREMMAVIVSDYRKAGLNERELNLCNYAEMLTGFPGKFKDDSLINNLKFIGLSDTGILDSTLVIAYFNFVNRIVLALGVETNESEIQGYKF